MRRHLAAGRGLHRREAPGRRRAAARGDRAFHRKVEGLPAAQKAVRPQVRLQHLFPAAGCAGKLVGGFGVTNELHDPAIFKGIFLPVEFETKLH